MLMMVTEPPWGHISVEATVESVARHHITSHAPLLTFTDVVVTSTLPAPASLVTPEELTVWEPGEHSDVISAAMVTVDVSLVIFISEALSSIWTVKVLVFQSLVSAVPGLGSSPSPQPNPIQTG